MAKAIRIPANAIPDQAILVENILAVYDSAVTSDPSAVVKGARWYADALNTCREIAESTGITVDSIVGIMAVTSITNGWENNEAAPLRVINYVKRNSVPYAENADDIAHTRPTWFAGNKYAWRDAVAYVHEHVFTLSGIKTRNFAANISGSLDNVTIDRHAMRIAMSDGILYDSVATGTYNKLADAYRVAAESRNIAPSEMQAITWTYYRRITATRGGKTIAEVYGD